MVSRRLAFLAVALLLACRPSGVDDVLDDLTQRLDDLPRCQVNEPALPVSAALALPTAQLEPPPKTLAVRGFLLPRSGYCTLIFCGPSNPCCNRCGLGFSLAPEPAREPQALEVSWPPGKDPLSITVNECELAGIARTTPRWEVVATGDLTPRPPSATRTLTVASLCAVTEPRAD
jgi:hypothetical protein